MTTKSTYRIRNWKAYNRSLINRGNLTVWISDDAIARWNQTTASGRRGRTPKYSDLAIESALMIRSLFQLPLRQTRGFLEGLFFMMKLNLDVPCYTTLSRRSDSLKVHLGHLGSKEPSHILIDATGLKVFGEGEWTMRTHGKSKRRTWRKFHVAIDRSSLEILAVTLTESNVHDSMQTKDLLDQIDNIATVTGDKGYDNKHAYDPIAERGARAIIPPRSGAAIKQKKPTWGDVERNRLVREKHLLGEDAWKSGSGYSRRSLVENAIGRYKKIFGPSLRARRLTRQCTEVRIGAKILNEMNHLGMPKSYKS